MLKFFKDHLTIDQNSHFYYSKNIVMLEIGEKGLSCPCAGFLLGNAYDNVGKKKYQGEKDRNNVLFTFHFRSSSCWRRRKETSRRR